MKRQEEYVLNEAVKKALLEKEVTEQEAVVVGYKLGHKYMDRGVSLDDVLPVIAEVIATTETVTFKSVGDAVAVIVPIPTNEEMEADRGPYDGRFMHQPFADLLKDFKVKK